MQLRSVIARLVCVLALLLWYCPAICGGAPPSPPVISAVSLDAGQLRFVIGGCLTTDGVQVQQSTNVSLDAWRTVDAFPARTNPIVYSTTPPANGSAYYRVVADRSLGLPLTSRGHELYNAFSNKVYFRGMGRANGNDSPVGDWYGPGGHYWDGTQWDYDFGRLADRMDATLQAMRLTYKCNMIREFLPVNWWWADNIDTGKYPWFPDATTSYRDYKELLVQRALLQGMYVDFCPYSFRSWQDGDGGGTAPALAAMDTNGIAVMNDIDSSDPTYLTAWRLWWTSVVQRLGKYPNVIFEIWNEPDGNNSVKSQYFDHCVEMYKTIRGLGNNNLIMMQWRMCGVPNWQEELTWIPALYNQIKAEIGHDPTNLVFTFHAYRYNWNLQWATNYDAILSQLQSPNWLPQTRSATVDVPVVCNESGPGLDLTGAALAAELSWWDGIIKACSAEDIGFCAYYWTPHLGWSPDSALIGEWPVGAPAPVPTYAGQMWIDAE